MPNYCYLINLRHPSITLNTRSHHSAGPRIDRPALLTELPVSFLLDSSTRPLRFGFLNVETIHKVGVLKFYDEEKGYMQQMGNFLFDRMFGFSLTPILIARFFVDRL